MVFGETDGAFDVLTVDIDGKPSVVADWIRLPFKRDAFSFGFWDPPYDHLYKQEGREIWRTCRRLAVLHTHVYPTSWFEGAKREAHIGVSHGPLKQMRALQIFVKTVPRPLF